MPRVIWKGSISFGLVHIPVGVYSGEKREELHFSMLDDRDKAPVGYKRINKQTGEEVPWERVVKGYEYDKDQYVVLGEEEFRRANVKATQVIEIIDFVDAKEIPFVYYDRPYFLEPILKGGEKGYALLRETLRRSHRVGVASVVLRNRQHLALVAPLEGILVLNLLRFHYEVRDVSEFKVPGEDLAALRISKREIEMAERLVDDMTTRWDPEKYRDEYRDDLMRVVQEKIESGRTLELDRPSSEKTPQGAKVIDFMTLLKRSVEEKEKGRTTKPRASKKKARDVPKRRGKKRA